MTVSMFIVRRIPLENDNPISNGLITEPIPNNLHDKPIIAESKVQEKGNINTNTYSPDVNSTNKLEDSNDNKDIISKHTNMQTKINGIAENTEDKKGSMPESHKNNI